VSKRSLGIDFKQLFSTRSIATASIIAALYVALTLALKPLAFGELGFECRISEAMTLLPVLFPEAIPGLTIGCLISNLFSPVGPLDIIFGTLATLPASVLSWMTRNMRVGSWRLPVVSAIWPVVFNGFIVGGVLTVEGFFASFPLALLVISVGEAIALVVGLVMFPGIEESLVTLSKRNQRSAR
jgi:uncharacterized membrane protein